MRTASRFIGTLLALGAVAPACTACGGAGAPPEVIDGGRAGAAGAGAGGLGGSAGSGGGRADGGTKDGSAGPDAAAGKWTAIDALVGCGGEVLEQPADSWPAREWSSCGAGCLASQAARTDEFARYNSSSARYEDGKLFLRTYAFGNVKGMGTRAFHELVSLPSGKPLVVLRHDTMCESSGIKEDVTFLFEVLPLYGDYLNHWAMYYDRASGVVHPTPELFKLGLVHPAWFAWNAGWGLIDGGNIRVVLDPASPTLTTVTPTGASLDFARARGDLVVWVDSGSKPNKIKSWTQAGGVRPLSQGSYNVVALALSDERMAWVGATGVDTGGGAFDTARLYWSPVAKDASGIAAHEGPDLTGLLQGRLGIAAGGDVIAVTTADTSKGGPAGLYVYRVSSSKLSFIPAPPTLWVTVAAVSPDEVVLMERRRDQDPIGFDRWLRFDLNHLDELAKGWK